MLVEGTRPAVLGVNDDGHRSDLSSAVVGTNKGIKQQGLPELLALMSAVDSEATEERRGNGQLWELSSLV